MGNAAKKPKLKTTAGSSAAELWDVLAIDIDPAQIVPAVIEAAENDEADKVVSMETKSTHTRYKVKYSMSMKSTFPKRKISIAPLYEI